MGPYQKYLHKCDNESDLDWGGACRREVSQTQQNFNKDPR